MRADYGSVRKMSSYSEAWKSIYTMEIMTSTKFSFITHEALTKPWVYDIDFWYGTRSDLKDHTRSSYLHNSQTIPNVIGRVWHATYPIQESPCVDAAVHPTLSVNFRSFDCGPQNYTYPNILPLKLNWLTVVFGQKSKKVAAFKLTRELHRKHKCG